MSLQGAFFQGTTFRWIRNGLAVVGALFFALCGCIFGLLFWEEQSYQARAQAASANSPSTTPATLRSAQTLIWQAGLVAAAEKRLNAGIDSSWDEGRHVEAYCLEVRGSVPAEGWITTNSLDPLLAKAAAGALDKAHKSLACIPAAAEVGARSLQVKLISANFDADHLAEVRVAARDARTGSYYLVFIHDQLAP